MGVAPDAGLVSVKVGDNTGATDISQVIAGVDWVTEHAAELDHLRWDMGFNYVVVDDDVQVSKVGVYGYF